MPGHCVPPLGPSVSMQLQPSDVGPQSNAWHRQARPGAGHPIGAQHRVFGNATSSHAVRFGVLETTQLHVCPSPKADAEHSVMFVVGVERRHVAWHCRAKQAASAVRDGAAAD